MADSAVSRKDNPVRLAASFVSRVKNTKIITGRSSIQAILDELARTETDGKGNLHKGGSAIFIAPELSGNLVSDPDAIRIMTDIYSYYSDYTSRLRGQGTFHIKDLCFSMLAASNKELLISVYDKIAVHGGLLGRTFLILPDEYRPPNSLFRPEKRPYEFEDIAKPLIEISKLQGEFLAEVEAMDEYDSWYKPFYYANVRKRSDKSGVAGRIHVSVLKIAMVIAVNSTQELIIRKCHIEEAISECVDLMPNYSQLTMASGKSPVSEIASIVLNEIYEGEKHQISRRRILNQHWQDFDVEQLDKIINTFMAAGFVDQFMDGNEIAYKLTKKCLEIENLFVKGKNDESAATS